MFSVLGGGFNYKLVKEQPDVAQYMMDFNHWYSPRNPKAIEMRKKVEADPTAPRHLITVHRVGYRFDP